MTKVNIQIEDSKGIGHVVETSTEEETKLSKLIDAEFNKEDTVFVPLERVQPAKLWTH